MTFCLGGGVSEVDTETFCGKAAGVLTSALPSDTPDSVTPGGVVGLLPGAGAVEEATMTIYTRLRMVKRQKTHPSTCWLDQV